MKAWKPWPINGISLTSVPFFLSLTQILQKYAKYAKYAKYDNIHAELAVEQRINVLVISWNQFGHDLLERTANTTMNHKKVPRPIYLLRSAQTVSAHNTYKIINMQ